MKVFYSQLIYSCNFHPADKYSATDADICDLMKWAAYVLCPHTEAWAILQLLREI